MQLFQNPGDKVSKKDEDQAEHILLFLPTHLFPYTPSTLTNNNSLQGDQSSYSRTPVTRFLRKTSSGENNSNIKGENDSIRSSLIVDVN